MDLHEHLCPDRIPGGKDKTMKDERITVTEETTLNKLLEMIGQAEKAQKTPTAKNLRENAGAPLAGRRKETARYTEMVMRSTSTVLELRSSGWQTAALLLTVLHSLVTGKRSTWLIRILWTSLSLGSSRGSWQ